MWARSRWGRQLLCVRTEFRIGKLPNVAPVVSLRTNVAVIEISRTVTLMGLKIVFVTRMTIAPRARFVGRFIRLVLPVAIRMFAESVS